MRIQWLKLYVYLVLALLFFPLLLIVIFSFNDNTLAAFPLTGFTLQWYDEVFSRRLYLLGFRNSMVVASCASLGAGLFGTLAAYGLNRHSPKLGAALLSFLTLPILVPGLVLGIAMLSYLSFLGVRRNLVTAILAHIVLSIPYVLLIMNACFHNFDWAVEEAACDLGANARQRIQKVLFPLIRPSLFGAMLLVFAISFDEFVVTYFVIGSQSTMPMIIWSMLRRSVTPALNAISTLLLIMSSVLLIVALKIFNVKLEL